MSTLVHDAYGVSHQCTMTGRFKRIELAERDNKLNAFRNRKRGHCAPPLVIDVARSLVESGFAHLIISVLIPFPLGIFFPINRPSRRSNLILLLFHGSIRNDNERHKLCAAALKFKFLPPRFLLREFNLGNIIAHRSRLHFMKNFNAVKYLNIQFMLR